MADLRTDGRGRFLPEPDNRIQAKSKRVVWIFFLFGTTVLYPWNGLLSAISYMDGVMFEGRGWALILTPSYNAISVSMQFLLILVGEHVALWKTLAVALPIGSAFAVLSMLCVVPDMKLAYEGALAGCLGIAMTAGGFMQASAGELTAKLMPRYGLAPAQFSNGIGFSSVFAVASFAGLSAALGEEAAVLGVFAITAVLFLLSALALAVLVRRGELHSTSSFAREERSEDADEAPAPPRQSASGNASPASVVAASPVSASACSEGCGEDGPPVLRRRSSLSRVSVSVARAWQQEVNLFAMYVQTFLVFPLAFLHMPAPRGVPAASYTFWLTSAFQLADLSGRILASFQCVLRLLTDGSRIWMLVVLRCLGFPLFYMCCKHVHGVFGHPAAHVATTVFWGLTNGALTNMAFLAGSRDARSEDRAIVGRALPLCLCCGILAGSFLSSSLVMQLA